MKTVAIITSRWNSTRLPGKALVDIGGKPMLQHIVDRARQAKVDEVAVATSMDSQPIVDYCEENGISYHIGSENNILERLWQTAKKFKADLIIRLWGDCPLIEPETIDEVIRYYLDNKSGRRLKYTYVYNSGIKGKTVACISYRSLSMIRLAQPPRIHRLWFHKYLIGRKHSYKIGEVKQEPDELDYSVDTQEDLDRVRRLYGECRRD